jgi:uncharacterized protein (TIGR02145 family)
MNKTFKSCLLPIIIFEILIPACCDKEKPLSGLPVDGDGNEYDTVVIGSQTWLLENLKTTKYINGIAIYLITDNSRWITYTGGAYCWYDNNPGYKETYGALYNWNAVSLNLLCPVEYHVPTDQEWVTLIDYLGGEEIAGNKLKATGTQFWGSGNYSTNESGFTAMPGGRRSPNDGTFNSMGSYGSWWSSSPGIDDDSGNRVDMFASLSYASLKGLSKKAGFSVRCIKN